MKFTHNALAVSVVAVLSSCNNDQVGSDSDIITEVDGLEEITARELLDSRLAAWAPGVVLVEAVVYNGGTRPGGRTALVDGAGTLHPDIVQSETVRLTSEDISALLDLVSGDYEKLSTAGCYLPHHGFLCYDSSSKIVGHLEVCLLCGHGGGRPMGGLAEKLEREGVNKGFKPFLASIGLPVFENISECEEYFGNANRAEQDANDRSATAGSSEAQ